MAQEKAMTISRIKKDALIITALGVVAVVAPAIGNQFFTGTLVNATLFIVAFRYGWKIGALVGVLPSGISLVIGFLVPAVAPLIPFIIASNLLLVWLFIKLKKQLYFNKAVLSVAAKTAFLFIIGFIVSQLVGDPVLTSIAAKMFTWMQGLTGLTGALLAWGVLRTTGVRVSRQ